LSGLDSPVPKTPSPFLKTSSPVMSLPDYVIRWLRKKLLDPQTSFLESDFDIGESSVMCKVRLSASERCNTRLGVCLDGEGRWKISNFTKHVLHKHMKNSTKSGLNKSGLKDDENIGQKMGKL